MDRAGRAVCVAKSLDGTPGTGNFDACDGLIESNGAKAILQALGEGRFGNLVEATVANAQQA